MSLTITVNFQNLADSLGYFVRRTWNVLTGRWISLPLLGVTLSRVQYYSQMQGIWATLRNSSPASMSNYYYLETQSIRAQYYRNLAFSVLLSIPLNCWLNYLFSPQKEEKKEQSNSTGHS